jgi:hypothetical protein
VLEKFLVNLLIFSRCMKVVDDVGVSWFNIVEAFLLESYPGMKAFIRQSGAARKFSWWGMFFPALAEASCSKVT